MTKQAPKHRLARISLGGALITIVIAGLACCIWRQSIEIAELRSVNEFLRHERPTPAQLLQQERTREQATLDINEWQRSKELKEYNDKIELDRQERLERLREPMRSPYRQKTTSPEFNSP